MRTDNPFDTRLESYRKSPHAPIKLMDAAVYVTDSLDLAWAAAQAVFGDKATPEVALAIYDRFHSRSKESWLPKSDGL